MLLLGLVLTVFGSDGFLLEHHGSTGNETLSKGPYLPVSSFLEEKDMLKQETERIKGEALQFRHDVNQKLDILTAQLTDKFERLEKRETCCKNMSATTSDLLELESKYSLLEQNFFALQKDYNELKKNQTLLLDAVLSSNSNIQNEVSNLKQLGGIKPLQDLLNLNHTVQALQIQTNALALKDQARSQDFLALHNMTVELQRQVNTNSEMVALLAYDTQGRTTTVADQQGFKFNHVTLNMGLRNNTIDEFRKTGKFICEKAGLYIISASIMAYTSDSDVFLYRNDDLVARGASGKEAWMTVSLAVTLHLSVNDIISLRVEGTKALYGGSSCYISIVKVK